MLIVIIECNFQDLTQTISDFFECWPDFGIIYRKQLRKSISYSGIDRTQSLTGRLQCSLYCFFDQILIINDRLADTIKDIPSKTFCKFQYS